MDIRKRELLKICQAAERLGIEVDPDGILEDREEVLRDKLLTPDTGMLSNPETLRGSQDLNILPPFSIFDNLYRWHVTFIDIEKQLNRKENY